MDDEQLQRAKYTISTALSEPPRPHVSVLAEMARTTPAHEALRRVLTDAIALVDATRCAIYLADHAAGELEAVITTTADSSARIPLGAGIIGFAAMQRKRQICENLACEERYQSTDGPRAGTLVALPLCADNQTLGVLVVASERVHTFGAKHLTCMQLLADYAAGALQRNLQTRSGDSNSKQLTTFVEAARAITTLQDAKTVFASISAGIKQIITYDDALIFAFDQEHNALRVVAAQGRHSDKLQAQSVSMGDPQSFSVQVALQRRPRLYAPESSGQGGQITEYFLGGQEQALLCVPLLSKDTLRGVVTLARQKAFTPNDLRVMWDLAPLVATALENVTLYANLHTEQERLAAIFAGTSEGIALIDGELRLTRVNGAFQRLAGSTDNLIGKPGLNAFVANGPWSGSGQYGTAALLTAFQEALQGGRVTASLDSEMPGSDPQQPRQVRVSVAPITVAGGRHIVVVARDVSDVLAAERMKAQFLHMVSHELRAPLHTLNGYLDLILSGGAGQVDDRPILMVRRARESGERLAGRVKDLLLLAHADAGYFTLQVGPVDLRQVIQQAMNEVDLAAKVGEVALHVNLPPILPPLSADAERLEQVVRNLLSNAIKFTPHGGHVGVEVRAQTHILELSVIDSGIGIAGEHLTRIFERFYQVADTQGRSRSGQGLGLAIVKAIIERHGGWVQVTSSPGQGSRFTIQLPLAHQFVAATPPHLGGPIIAV